MARIDAAAPGPAISLRLPPSSQALAPALHTLRTPQRMTRATTVDVCARQSSNPFFIWGFNDVCVYSLYGTWRVRTCLEHDVFVRGGGAAAEARGVEPDQQHLFVERELVPVTYQATRPTHCGRSKTPKLLRKCSDIAPTLLHGCSNAPNPTPVLQPTGSHGELNRHRRAGSRAAGLHYKRRRHPTQARSRRLPLDKKRHLQLARSPHVVSGRSVDYRRDAGPH